MPNPALAKATQTDFTATIDQYKSLSEIAIKDAISMFQTVVTQALLPVFTAILGNIFGRAGRES
jgi:hypothetical protein